MKKLLCLAMVLMMLLGMTCAQADTLYHMPEMSMAVNLSDDFVVLTRDTEEEIFAALGLDGTAIVNYMVANDTYMVLFPGDFGYEIDVSMGANTIDSFNNYTEAELLEIIPVVVESLESMGVVCDKGDFYTNGRDHYLRMFYHVPGDVVTYAVQYYTVQNHQAINFRLFITGMEATAEQLAEYERVMENVIFE